MKLSDTEVEQFIAKGSRQWIRGRIAHMIGSA